jgi:ABC-2 type transport system ATP-binding protein
MNNIIETVNITKKYGSFTAVNNVSINIRKSEVYGFLGLNGAGKTTTIRMLLGMTRPTSGESFLNGKKVHSGSHELWHSVGYLVEIPYSYPDLTVWENLEMIRRLRFIPDPGAVDAVIEQLQLGPYQDRMARHLSQGNAQRLGIAKAIIHHPDILILDEPSNGLDPAGIVEIREMLRDFALNKGVTVLISSHILGEISKFATRIGIIHEGRLIQEVDTDRLDQLRHKRLLIDAHNKEAVKSTLIKEGYTVNKSEEGTLEIKNEKAVNHPDDVATLLVHARLPPTVLRVEEEDLESFFLRTIGMNGGVK